jgi:hypothetical protein
MAENGDYLQGAEAVDYLAFVISEETRYRWKHYDRTQYKAAMQAVFVDCGAGLFDATGRPLGGALTP